MARYVDLARRETWAIDRDWLLATLADGLVVALRSPKLPKVDGTVAILPLHGMITQRASIWQELFGGTSTQGFGAAYTRAVNDDRIKAIVLDVDSPGGTTAGVEELADIIHEGAEIKSTFAVANGQTASAAYWIASQVGKGHLFASPGSDVGSIGVFRMHEDVSGALAKEGVKVEFIATPQYKTEGNPYEPLTAEAREFNRSQVEATYEVFANAVARGRKTSRKTIQEKYGEGRSFHAADAFGRGMVDDVRSLGQVLAGLGVGSGKTTVTTAEAQLSEELSKAWQDGLPMAMNKPPYRDWRRRLFLLTTPSP